VLRGIETLALRVKTHSENALAIAGFLKTRKEIKDLYYPVLETHINHEAAKAQQKYFGGIISFSLKEDTEENALKLIKSTKLFKLAESLGGPKSLICNPATMTHKSIPQDIRKKSGVCDSLIRLSIGLEDAEDLIEDLENAFNNL
jgi:cystathionine beta-lyase